MALATKKNFKKGKKIGSGDPELSLRVLGNKRKRSDN
jgi:hypothetical protein